MDVDKHTNKQEKKADFTVDLTQWGLLRLAPISIDTNIGISIGPSLNVTLSFIIDNCSNVVLITVYRDSMIVKIITLMIYRKF